MSDCDVSKMEEWIAMPEQEKNPQIGDTIRFDNGKVTVIPAIQCKGCGYNIAACDVYCGECLCEDDCGI